MIRREARLRREYIYRKSLEEKQRASDEKRKAVKDAIDNNKRIPSHLRKNAIELMRGSKWGLQVSTVKGPELDDEYRYAGTSDPKIVITTSRSPSSKLKVFVKEVRLMFPNAQRMNRGHYDVKKLIQACKANDVTDFILLQETRGSPDGMVVCHLPFGPTAFFTLSNVVMRHDVPDRENISEEYPHIIMNNLNSTLGKRFSCILKHLYPVPKPESRRIITFSNEEDVISFRHHKYKKSETEIELNEIGPRFEMRRMVFLSFLKHHLLDVPSMKSIRKLYSICSLKKFYSIEFSAYCIKLGTFENIVAAETEWILRPYLNTAMKRLLLSVPMEDDDEV